MSVNKQHNRDWSDSCPFEGIEMPLNDFVWCAISLKKIYGTSIFENTVNQNNLEMLKKILLAETSQDQ